MVSRFWVSCSQTYLHFGLPIVWSWPYRAKRTVCTKLDTKKNLYTFWKNDQRKYKYSVLGRGRLYFVRNKTLILPKSVLKLISSTLWNMFYWQHIYGRVWYQTVDFILYSYEENFIYELLKKREKRLPFKFTFPLCR